MCGRYELHTQPAALALAFGVAFPPQMRPRYNIAPMQDVPIIRHAANGEREVVDVRWGLVPRWAKDPAIGNRMINARSETLAEKPSFRTALKRHRCLLPADGFYEWKQSPSGGKQPIHIGMKDGTTFAFAGLFERWLSPAGEVLDTCTIITTRANALLSPLHERMPVIVPPAAYDRWLDVANEVANEVANAQANEDPSGWFASYPAEAMTYYPVSARVNAVKNDDASLIARVEEAQPQETAAEPEASPPTPAQDSLF